MYVIVENNATAEENSWNLKIEPAVGFTRIITHRGQIPNEVSIYQFNWSVSLILSEFFVNDLNQSMEHPPNGLSK